MNVFMCTALLGVLLLGCSEYPGHRTSDAVKPGPTPPWTTSGSAEVVQGGDCHIDSINDKSAEEPFVVADSRSGPDLKVLGWAAISIKDGVTAEQIAISLKGDSASGERLFVPAAQIKRADVAEHFRNAALIDTGFNAVMDLSDLPPGKYILQVVSRRDGIIYGCKYTSTVVVD